MRQPHQRRRPHPRLLRHQRQQTPRRRVRPRLPLRARLLRQPVDGPLRRHPLRLLHRPPVSDARLLLGEPPENKGERRNRERHLHHPPRSISHALRDGRHAYTPVESVEPPEREHALRDTPLQLGLQPHDRQGRKRHQTGPQRPRRQTGLRRRHRQCPNHPCRRTARQHADRHCRLADGIYPRDELHTHARNQPEQPETDHQRRPQRLFHRALPTGRLVRKPHRLPARGQHAGRRASRRLQLVGQVGPAPLRHARVRALYATSHSGRSS